MQTSSSTKKSKSGAYYQIIVRSKSELIFRDKQDYGDFLSLFNNYLHMNNSVDVLAYCLRPNDFCFLVFESKDKEISRLMQHVLTDYNRFYHDKYQINDLLSDGDCTKNIVQDDKIMDISRKIHISSNDWIDCEYSSIRAYFYDDDPTWINKKHIVDKFGSAKKYLKFLQEC